MLFGKMLQECVMELACLDNCRCFLERANRVQPTEQKQEGNCFGTCSSASSPSPPSSYDQASRSLSASQYLIDKISPANNPATHRTEKCKTSLSHLHLSFPRSDIITQLRRRICRSLISANFTTSQSTKGSNLVYSTRKFHHRGTTRPA
jgi:hypothetical protein